MNGVQRKRACSEWRRARSRTAARGRRERESLLFRELAQGLPLTPDLRGHLDKASILRLSVTYLRLRAVLGDADCPQGGAQHAVNAASRGRGSAARCPDEKVLDSALGGFLLLVSQSGQIIYATDGMSTHTGVSQMDLIGQSLYHFTHPSDQKEIRSILSGKSGIENKQQHNVFLRMKSVITSQGRTVNMKSAFWKVLHCTVTRKHSAALGTSCLVLLCHPLPDLMPSSRDVCLSRAAFLSRHTPDMRFNYCQSRMEDLIGYTEYELLGQSVYQYYHAMDCQDILRVHLNLFSKGKASTGKYRFLMKQGGFVWMETDATVVYDNHTRQPQSIICVNYILSGTEESEVLFSLEQKEHLKPSSSDPTTGLGPVLLAGSNGSCPGIMLEKPMPTAVCEVEERGEARDNTFTLIETLLDWNSTKNVQNFSLDCAEEDLDTLAPYIPMDGEDFLLTPLPEVEEEKAEMGQQGAFQCCVQCCEIEGYVWPRSSATCQSLHTSLPPCVSSQTQPAVLTCCGLALTGSQSWESVKTDCSNSMMEMFRLGKQDVQTQKRYWSDRHLPSSGNQQYTQYSCHSWTCGPSTASQWKKVKPDPIQIKGKTPFWTRSDDMVSGCYQVPLGFVPWAPQYRHISSSSPVQVSLHTDDRCLVRTHWKAESPWSVLPVLSCLECEVNAPLGPSSCLLYGAEILSVLDQAALKLCP